MLELVWMTIEVNTRQTNMGWRFSVSVTDQSSISLYQVSMDQDFLTRIGSHHQPEKIIEKSFEFLLENEPKEQILQEFDVTTISHYYPHFLVELQKKLDY